MLAVIGLSEKVFLDHWKEPSDFFSIWRIASRDIHTQASEKQLQPLLASFGVSLVERAVMDAICVRRQRTIS